MLTGVEVDGLGAVKTHYALLVAVMRVINAAVLSRGEQNEQTLTQARRFLSENRLSVLAVFKKSINIGKLEHNIYDEAIDDLAEAFMVLITLTNFINVRLSCH